MRNDNKIERATNLIIDFLSDAEFQHYMTIGDTTNDIGKRNNQNFCRGL